MQLSELPQLGVLLVVAGCCFLVAFYCRQTTIDFPWGAEGRLVKLPMILGCCFIGLFWQGWHCQALLAQRLSSDQEMKELQVIGVISDLPNCDDKHCSFNFNIEEISSNKRPMTVRLSWYGVDRPLQVGERWQLTVRLKKPRGTLNPGSFDFEAWSWQHHLAAKGYVSNKNNKQNSLSMERQEASSKRFKNEIIANHHIDPAAVNLNSLSSHTLQQKDGQQSQSRDNSTSQADQIERHTGNRYLGQASGYQLPMWRERLLKSCQVLLKGEALGGIITALNLGWTQDVSYSQRIVVQRTGTAHLLAISGLHVGMVAGLVAWLLRWLWSAIPRVTEYVPAPTVAAVGAILAALIYSEMAGFACSTQRACVMSALLFLPKIAHRHMSVKTALFRAVWVVLLWDPCVVQSGGFWLSFMAVFVLIYARYAPDLGRWAQHFEAQWVCLIGLLPLSILYFHQISLVSVVANLIAIPVVGFLVLPLVLLGSALATQQAFLAKLIFSFALKILACLGIGLSWLAQQDWAVYNYSFSHWWEFLIVTMGCAVVVFTQQNWRWVGLVGIVPLALPNAFPVQSGQFKLSVLDVGQGLATVISTRHHTLIYDTGAKFSPQLDCGQSIVIPYLILEKIRTIDALVVSHGDNDHAGGAMAILQQMTVKKFYTSAVEHFMARISPTPKPGIVASKVLGVQPNASSTYQSGPTVHPKIPLPTNCAAGTHWDWDGVKFEFLHPPSESIFNANDRSCVLKVSSPSGSVLFPGDIEKPAEQWLSEHIAHQLASTVIIVPHHGSKTSSTADFIAAVHPKVAIMSYGYRNRYRHPNAQVVQRYLDMGTDVFNTVSTGAIVYTMGLGAPWQLYRQRHREFWRVHS
jgi:competence protein ComEC